MIFLETSQPLTRADISEVEKELGIAFPNDLVMHYLNYNGGYPEGDTYQWKSGEVTTINTFYSLKYDGFGRIETTYKNLVLDENYLPIGIVPFATDDGGNFFCISTRGKDFGNVYYSNNDHYDIEDKESALSLLENNFTNFIDKLS